ILLASAGDSNPRYRREGRIWVGLPPDPELPTRISSTVGGFASPQPTTVDWPLRRSREGLLSFWLSTALAWRGFCGSEYGSSSAEQKAEEAGPPVGLARSDQYSLAIGNS